MQLKPVTLNLYVFHSGDLNYTQIICGSLFDQKHLKSDQQQQHIFYKLTVMMNCNNPMWQL